LRLLEAARLAPSACNFQEWRFVVVRNPETRKRLAIAANKQMYIGEAPVVIVCCAENDGYVMACGQQCYPILDFNPKEFEDLSKYIDLMRELTKDSENIS